jgi:hypothetical protein
VHELSARGVTLATEKQLPARRLLLSAAAEAQQEGRPGGLQALAATWRLDKDEVASSSTQLRTSVLSLFTSTGRQASACPRPAPPGWLAPARDALGSQSRRL